MTRLADVPFWESDAEREAYERSMLVQRNGTPHRVESSGIILDRNDPMPTARTFVEAEYSKKRRLLCFRGDFYRYVGTHWELTSDTTLDAELWAWLDAANARDRKTIERFRPNRRMVGDTLAALRAAVILDEKYEPPCWTAHATLDPRRLLPLQNGLLDIESGMLHPHSPAFFATYSLPVLHSPTAAEPTRWLTFLGELWPGDRESIDTLGELFGYVLSGDTTLQKIGLIAGPPRGGKGTICAVLRALVGASNVAGQTLAGLGTNFGLAPLINRPLCIISDARLSGRTDSAIVCERLLSISGEDVLTVDRKGRDAWTGQLPTRFIVATNEAPRLADASGALASRFIALSLRHSWLGRENTSLRDELLAELPGILQWSLAGLKRLRQRGRFVQPESGAGLLDSVSQLASPVAAFVADDCELDPGDETAVADLYAAWCRWCQRMGRQDVGDRQRFGRDLKAACPGIDDRRPRTEDGKRERVYRGIRLRVEWRPPC